MNLARVASIGSVFLCGVLASCGSVPPPPAERAKDLPQARTPTPEERGRVRELREAAAAALERGDTKKSLALVEQALSLDNADARSHLVLGFTRMADARRANPPILHLWESAEVDFLLATRLDPKDPEVFFALGLFYRDDGHAEASLDAFRKALAIDPYHRRTLIAAGRMLHERGRESEALPLLERLLAFREQDPDATYRLGQCRLELGQFEEAAQAFRRYRELAPEDPEGPLAEAATRWRALKQQQPGAATPEEAKEILELLASASELAPKDPRPVFDSALFHEERGEKVQALELYAQALSLDPDHVPTLLNLAHLLDATGDTEEARRLLARALPMLKERREKRAVEAWLRTVSGEKPPDSRAANPGTVSGPNPHDAPGTRPAR